MPSRESSLPGFCQARLPGTCFPPPLAVGLNGAGLGTALSGSGPAYFLLVMEALQAGARDFIVKPFKPDAVVATLGKVLEKED